MNQDTNQENGEKTYIRRLPHLQTENRPLFLTWRLAFNLPQTVSRQMKQIKSEFDQSITNLSKNFQEMQRYQFDKKQFIWYDNQLNDKALPDLLAKKDIAGLVREALEYYHNKKYELIAYCIMPNHVHAIIQLLREENGKVYPLATITQNWKRYSARQIHMLLKREGSLWQAECYDHVIRNEKEYGFYIDYTLNNPVKAGLVDDWNKWEFSWLSDSIEV